MRSRFRERPPAAAFTLIELLVVVAIIALLMSILLPALSRAKARARQLRCLTNLRSQGQAVFYYAEEHDGWMLGGRAGIITGEWGTYFTTVLKGLAWDGQVRDVWGPPTRRRLNRAAEVFRSIPQLQCPDHPVEDYPLDYVSSAMPIPYTQNNLTRDRVNPPGKNPQHRGEPYRRFDYVDTFRMERFHRGAHPAQLIYVTEAHASLQDWRRHAIFHHFFVGSQLPFGGLPRMANDQRHPGGLNNLFFDGHANTMALRKLDIAWPNPIQERLKWFTAIPPELRGPGP